MTRPQAAASQVRALGSGRYELKTKLAAGGMGTIFLARDRFAKREVAYKRLAIPHEGERALRTALFQREYDMLSQLPHPNIVEVYDYGEESGAPYYVMELLVGSDLTTMAPLHYREACRVLRDIASALALLHTRRLIHRDVSPNNVRLTADGMAKLIDFGALAPFGRAKELVGTPAFIAPECLSDTPLDQRTDLYAVGALAYWALTRKTPVYARSIEDLATAFEDPPLAPSLHVPGIPRELDELVLSMLAHDPAARPANAAYVIERLTSIADLGPETDERRVAQSYLAHPPLCGREAIQGGLAEAIDAAHEGHGMTILIEGEAGLGRTALLEASALRAQLSGAVVLKARGDASALSFRTARTLVEAAFALYPDLAEVESSPSSVFSYHHTARAGAPDAIELAERHAAVIEASRRTLLEAVKRTPLVLVVDDVHLCDAESVALLASLALETGRTHLSLICSGLSGHSAGDGSTYAMLSARARRFTIAPFTRLEVGEVIQAIFGAVPNSLALAHWLYDQGGGNAANTIDLTRLLMQRDIIRYQVGTFVLPPKLGQDLSIDDLSHLVLARLGDLRSEVEQLATVLSLHLGALTDEQLTAATELPFDTVLVALEELVHRGVLMKSQNEYTFVGSSLRAALQHNLPPDATRTLHAKLARALSVHPSEAVHPRFDTSMHYLQAGEENEALRLIVGVAHRVLYGTDAARWSSLLEAALAICLRQRRSKEESLSLMLPLAASAFHGSARLSSSHADTALAWTADVCGMALANRLRPFLGGALSLATGIFYAVLRRAFTPKPRRLGSLGYMISYFVGLVCDAIATYAIMNDGAASRRYLRRIEPLRVLPKGTPGHAMREFCQATTDLTAGRLDLASTRYAELLELLKKPIKGLEHSQKTLYLGTLNGRAVCEAGVGSKLALELADELSSDAFFAAHAEVVRVSYHAIRGDREQAAIHRERAEQLALRGGTSWSATVTLTILNSYAANLTEDAIAILQAIDEFQRIADFAPKLQVQRRISEAWLAHLRGRSEAAIAIFEELIDTDDAENLTTALVNRALFANVLNSLGQHARAVTVCERVLQVPHRRGERTLGMRWFMREFAVAEAGLGRLDDAVVRLEQQMLDALPLDNPLELGAGHRDRARIALLAKDATAFDAHFAAMESYFRRTKNPCLIAQCEALAAKAVRLGLRAEVRPVRASMPMSDMLDEHTVVEEIPNRQSG